LVSSTYVSVKDNPPAKDGLSVEDCERIIVSLLLEKVLSTNPIWNAYSTVIYFVLGSLGSRMEQSENPRFVIQLPKLDESSTAKPTAAAAQSKSRKSVASGGDWLSVKSKGEKKAASTKSKPAKKAKTTKKKAAKTKRVPAKRVVKARPKRDNSDVIELLSDDDSKPTAEKEDLWNSESSDEAEFED
jgi:hypothetical protein